MTIPRARIGRRSTATGRDIIDGIVAAVQHELEVERVAVAAGT